MKGKDVIIIESIICNLILQYYMYYRNIRCTNYEPILNVLYNIIGYEYQKRFSSFDAIYGIELLEFPYNHIYLLNNDIDYKELESILFDYIYKHYHTINNCDIIISINPVPFDGLDIRHGDILNMLDPYFI